MFLHFLLDENLGDLVSWDGMVLYHPWERSGVMEEQAGRISQWWEDLNPRGILEANQMILSHTVTSITQSSPTLRPLSSTTHCLFMEVPFFLATRRCTP